MIYKFKDQTFILAAFFSLGLHGILVLFLIPFPSQRFVRNESVIQVVWEKEAVSSPASVRYSPPRKTSKPLPKPKQKQIVLSTQTTLPAQKTLTLQNSYSNENEKRPQGIILPPSPRKAYCPLPDYPWICRKRRQQGMVSLDVKTNADGRVLEVNMHKSSGHSRLDEVAIEAVKTWTLAEGSQKKVLTLAFRLKK